jgi:hypothetical protein
MSETSELPPDGTVVRAKRLGWDEKLTPEQQMDLDEYDHDNAELEGPVRVVRADSPATGAMTLVLVGGQEADEKTIEVI